MAIYLSRAANDTQGFLGILLQVGNGARYFIAELKYVKIDGYRTPTYVQTLRDVI